MDVGNSVTTPPKKKAKFILLLNAKGGEVAKNRVCSLYATEVLRTLPIVAMPAVQSLAKDVLFNYFGRSDL